MASRTEPRARWATFSRAAPLLTGLAFLAFGRLLVDVALGQPAAAEPTRGAALDGPHAQSPLDNAVPDARDGVPGARELAPPDRVSIDDATRWIVGLIVTMGATLLLVGVGRAFYWAPRAMFQRFETAPPPRSERRESEVAESPPMDDIEPPRRRDARHRPTPDDVSLEDDAEFPV